jgi:hypothetical protein
MIRRWPFDRNEPVLVAQADEVSALAVDDPGELMALCDWPRIEVWSLGTTAEGAATLRHALDWPALSGTGDALDWHPRSGLLAYSGAERAKVFTSELEPFWFTETESPSDVRFSDDGSLLAIGDWSKGAVHAWPPW